MKLMQSSCEEDTYVEPTVKLCSFQLLRNSLVILCISDKTKQHIAYSVVYVIKCDWILENLTSTGPYVEILKGGF